ncbi:MAG: FG-GAP-like repeat-containing protein, partial [Candidatus Omnitrophota bacterium]
MAPNEEVTINIQAVDPDNDPMTFSVEKNNEKIYEGNIIDTCSFNTSFPSTGDYAIKVSVADAGIPVSLNAEVVKNVDVKNPIPNPNVISPVMGDFNGDALTDLGLHNHETGMWEVCLSEHGVFEAAMDWLNSFGTSKDWWPVGGDFNGDGKTDIGVYNNINGQLKIAYSTGTSFSVSGITLTASFASYIWQPFTGNFNGDKYTDFALYNKDTGEVKVNLGSSAGFSSFDTWGNAFGKDNIALGGDFNGDSLTDLGLFKKSTGEFKVAFSNAEAFVDNESWIQGFATDKDPIMADFNNDGLTDIGYWNKSNQKWYYAISGSTSTGIGFLDKGEWLIHNFGTSNDDTASIGDFNGDGIIDAATFDRERNGIERWTVQISNEKPAGLLTQIDNGIGGETKIEY